MQQSAARVPYLEQQYEKQFDIAAGEDREKASLMLVPHIARVV